MWAHRHLLGIEDLSVADIETILERASKWKGQKNSTLLQGRTVMNLFFEVSTRTRTSFEIAAQRLGADVVNVSPSTSSVAKGETLLDTAKNLEAMRTDLFVLRHQSSGTPAFLAQRLDYTHIVNAGDGAHEHPTQALLDAFTMRQHKGRLAGLVVVICGDILHSRVARSNALLLGKLGAEVRLCAPKTMMPLRAEDLGQTVKVVPHLRDAMEGADVVMMLRIQTERLVGAMMSTTREYARTFGLNQDVLSRAKPDAIVMHPGPINRGVELNATLADSDRSVILDQVENGVAVRMAVLDLLLSTAA